MCIFYIQCIILSIHISPVATLTCSVLDDPTDGSVQYSSVDVGSVAEYTCNEGFLLEGATTRVCQTDGSWSGDTPTCRRGLFSLIDTGIF